MSLTRSASIPPSEPSSLDGLTAQDIHKAHFLQSQVLLYQILHEHGSRFNEANDLANHISDIVGEAAWNHTEDLIADLLDGLRLDENYDRVAVCDKVFRRAAAYTTDPKCATRLQRPLERLGRFFWGQYIEATRAAAKAAGDPPLSIPQYKPLSRETAKSYRPPPSNGCDGGHDGQHSDSTRKFREGRSLGRFRIFLIRVLLGEGWELNRCSDITRAKQSAGEMPAF
ncbi:uncharacterized protein MYCGRDRAFT_94696 [Zymoseptoria tritici IPO323]|uniref:Uncharacterized protein n=1 Tax=Zymoseptoria tritici (strain CBS 115943 / IPO323) TaxID=336722 RepID=F9XGS4_ZYMTI|nr:uncharacterized protein MYCGRDRAFT_94696 [Zymoseptoria tritici IPO323]EGP85985.1 hypothetical protein MYCGRDRAFT_94696 [Zymoseptoria tritici IPO323]